MDARGLGGLQGRGWCKRDEEREPLWAGVGVEGGSVLSAFCGVVRCEGLWLLWRAICAGTRIQFGEQGTAVCDMAHSIQD